MSKFDEWIVANTPEPVILHGLKADWYASLDGNSVTWTCYKFGDMSKVPEELKPRTIQTPEEVIELPVPGWIRVQGGVYWGTISSRKLFRSEAEELARDYIKDLSKMLNL